MGLTALDTGVLIGLLDGSDPFHRPARHALLEATSSGPVLLPGVAYAESLIAVLRAGASQDLLHEILTKLRITIGTCTQEVLAAGATLRVAALSDRRRRQWKLPDALVVAEAVLAGATTLVTTDGSWPLLPDGPNVRVLDPSGSQ